MAEASAVIVGRIACGDCSAPDPDWVSINRCLLLCNDCCFIHRSLGPQYSNVKSLTDGDWNPVQKAMVLSLAGGAANHVWEHLLLDRSKAERESGVKKPLPYDTLEVKRKFIQLKHLQFQFVPKPSQDQIEVKSQELHSTVRTASVDTTLRLLAGGGDPNYFHPEKGTRPMHVAARNGQGWQVELLHLHGAHASAPDYLGQTPMEHAIAAGHRDLALRLPQLQYALTDQLTHFVCQEWPDHSSGRHILVPGYRTKSAKQEADIINMACYLLEQLAADLLDEVGRREIERLVVQKFGTESPKFSIAFLPVNPHYPAVRNQGRQKYARLTDAELCSMITIVLSETDKRHRSGLNGGIQPSDPLEAGEQLENIFQQFRLSEAAKTLANGGSKAAKKSTGGGAAGATIKPGVGVIPPSGMVLLDDDDYPLYDSVASDEDLILAEQQIFLAAQKSKVEERPSFVVNSSSSSSASNAKVAPIMPSSGPGPTPRQSESEIRAYREKLLLTKLMDADAELHELLASNRKLEQECYTLRDMVKSCLAENLQLLSTIKSPFAIEEGALCCPEGHGTYRGPGRGGGGGGGGGGGKKSAQRPSSMVELVPAKEKETDGGKGAAASNANEFAAFHGGILCPGVTPVAHDATLKTVELIKDLISSAISVNLGELRRASREIFKVVDDLTKTLVVVPEVKSNEEVMKSLQKLSYHTLKLNHEIPALVSANPRNSNSDRQLVPAVRQLCLDVGSAMKDLVYLLSPDQPTTGAK